MFPAFRDTDTRIVFQNEEKTLEFILAKNEQLKQWLEWWDIRKGYIFRAFASSGPRMNQAESVHGGWAKKDAANMTLLKVAEADVRESTLLDAEHSAIRAGNSTAGRGPTARQRDARQHEREVEAARKLGQELFDEDGMYIDESSSHRPPPPPRKGTKNKKRRQRRQRDERDEDN